jgi:RimJ/RimL family protein N-acetyltransferase
VTPHIPSSQLPLFFPPPEFSAYYPQKALQYPGFLQPHIHADSIQLRQGTERNQRQLWVGVTWHTRVSQCETVNLFTTLLNTIAATLPQKVGPPVSPKPAAQPSRIVLSGTSVTLVPLTPDHTADLFDAVGGEEKRALWTYMGDGPFLSRSEFENAIVAKSKSEDPLFFAIINNETQKPIGYTTLMRIDAKSRSVEVGNIMFSPLLQRTKAATEAMYLLAKHAFVDLGYRRYEWKCDNLNGPSKRAAIRFGFTFEGIFRQHMIYKSRSRDTAWFSIVDTEWPVVQRAFEAWLHNTNFDEHGQQKHRLEDLREALRDQRGPVVLQTD